VKSDALKRISTITNQKRTNTQQAQNRVLGLSND
jgi:hypothetical protein